MVGRGWGDGTYAELVTHLTILNAQKCVVGLLEDTRNTAKVLAHWFPWTRVGHEDEPEVGWDARTRGTKTMQGALPVELREVMEEELRGEIEVYRWAQARFAEQLRALNVSTST